MASTESNSSRFNPFKFNSKPPPLPPKDPIYLRSPPAPAPASVVDNNPTTTVTEPSSPISPTIQYAIRRANSPSPFAPAENNHIFAANMNYSASSLLTPPPSSQPQQVQRQDSTSSRNTNASNGYSRYTSATSSKKDKALAFLKFPKRSPRSPPSQTGPSNPGSSSGSVMVTGSDEGEDIPPPPQEDDNISLPWNFQVRVLVALHNFHQDPDSSYFFSSGSIIYTSTMGMFFSLLLTFSQVSLFFDHRRSLC